MSWGLRAEDPDMSRQARLSRPSPSLSSLAKCLPWALQQADGMFENDPASELLLDVECGLMHHTSYRFHQALDLINSKLRSSRAHRVVGGHLWWKHPTLE